MQQQRLKQQQQALMQQALLQQQSIYHPGLLAPPQVLPICLCFSLLVLIEPIATMVIAFLELFRVRFWELKQEDFGFPLFLDILWFFLLKFQGFQFPIVTTSLLAFFWFFWVLLEINEKLINLCEMCCFLRTFNEFDNIFLFFS
jgi:hypothetical protein